MMVGIRIVSDPRDTTRDREEFYQLRNFLSARYLREGWDCVDLPREEGETPVFRTFIKQRCRKTVDGAVADCTPPTFARRVKARSTTAPDARPRASSKAWYASS